MYLLNVYLGMPNKGYKLVNSKYGSTQNQEQEGTNTRFRLYSLYLSNIKYKCISWHPGLIQKQFFHLYPYNQICKSFIFVLDERPYPTTENQNQKKKK